MRINLGRILRNLTLSSLFLLGAAVPAHAAGGAVPAQVWVGSYSARQTKVRATKYDLPSQKMPSGRQILVTNPETRLETELQSTVPLKDLSAMTATMDELVANPAKVKSLLGPGYSVVKLGKAPRDMADPYYDSANGDLAKAGASLRIRIENGVAKVNYKPPTAERFDNGVAHRIEAGIVVKLDANGQLSDKTVDFLTNSRLKDNPLREFSKHFPKLDLREVLKNKVLELKQKRAIYEVQLNGVRINEVSVDHVIALDPKTGKSFEFGSFEGEGDHLALVPTEAQLAKMRATTWKGPHTAADTRNPSMVGTRDPAHPGVLGKDASPDVKQVHMVAEAFTKHFQEAGLTIVPAGQNKYVRSRLGLNITEGR